MIRLGIVIESEFRPVTVVDIANTMRQAAEALDRDYMLLDIATDPVMVVRLPDAIATITRIPVE